MYSDSRMTNVAELILKLQSISHPPYSIYVKSNNNNKLGIELATSLILSGF
jgi:hypothetical protein